jgi:hypothetical protein
VKKLIQELWFFRIISRFAVKKKQEKRGKTRKNQEKPGKGEQKKGSFLARFGVEEKFLMMSGLVLLAWV